MVMPDIESAQAGRDTGPLRIVQFNATFEGFGMVMDYVARHPPFSDFEAKTLVEAIHQQLRFGHNLVALNHGEIIGYAGWLLTSTEIAERWVAGQGGLIRKQGAEAQAAALTIVVSEDRAAITRLMRGARRLNPGKRAYFKRGADAHKSERKRSVRV